MDDICILKRLENGYVGCREMAIMMGEDVLGDNNVENMYSNDDFVSAKADECCVGCGNGDDGC